MTDFRQTSNPKAYARIKDHQGTHYHTADFDNIANYLKWKWNSHECGVGARARPRLDNFKNISEDITRKWLESCKRVRCCGMYSRERNAEDISKELEKGWRVDSLTNGDHGNRARVKFQTRTDWDSRVCKDRLEAWKGKKERIKHFHKKSYTKVEHRNFKVSSDVPMGRTEHVAGVDRWNMHHLMRDVDLDDHDTLLGRPTTFFGIPPKAQT